MPQALPLWTTLEVEEEDTVGPRSSRRFSIVSLLTGRRSSASKLPVVCLVEDKGTNPDDEASKLTFSHEIGKRGMFEELRHVALQPQTSRHSTGRNQHVIADTTFDSSLVLSDAGSNRVLSLSLQDGRPLGEIMGGSSSHKSSIPPHRDEQGGAGLLLRGPRGVACDLAGHAYIVEWAMERVQKVRLDDCVVVAATKGAKLKYPEAAALYEGQLYVTDTGNHRVVVLDGSTLQVLNVAGSRGAQGCVPGEPPQLKEPRGIAAHDGRLFIADCRNDRVVVLSLTHSLTQATPQHEREPSPRHEREPWMRVERVIGGSGRVAGLFQRPYGVAATDAALFVTEEAGCRLQVLTHAGAPLQVVAFSSIARNPPPMRGVCASASGAVCVVVGHKVRVFETKRPGPAESARARISPAPAPALRHVGIQ